MTTRRTSPYVGLVPFSVDDAEFFFGRGAETGLVISNLTSSRLTLLYGPSGVGKSSLVDAGVTHRVRSLARERVARLGPSSAAVRAVVEGVAGVQAPVPAGFGTPSVQAVRAGAPGEIHQSGSPVLEDEERRLPPMPPVPVLLNAWRDDPTLALAERIRTAVAEVYGAEIRVTVPEGATLRELLSAWTERLRSDLYVILDQFDEFFLYHPEDQPGAFADQLADAVGDPGLRANFLLSLREDTLASLDRFKGRIPGLFSNYLRLEYLDSDAARLAITGPVERFNTLVGADESIRLGDETDPGGDHLVDEVLTQVRAGRGLGDAEAESGLAGATVVAGAALEDRVETPYLQLVMARLWKEERERGSDALRLSTLRDLGGAERIVSQHLEEVLGTGSEDRETAARLFAHLVTSAGRKIALTVPELSYAASVPEERIAPVVKLLRDRNVLRSAGPPPGQPENERTRRYEITHDVLAIAALRWRAEFLRLEGVRRAAADAHQAVIQRERRRRRWILMGTGVLLSIGAAAWLVQRDRQRDEKIRAMQIAALSVMVSAVAREELGPDPSLAAALADTADRLYSTSRSVDVLRQALFGPVVVQTFGGVALQSVAAVAFSAQENVFMVHNGGFVQVWNSAGRQLRVGDVQGPVEDAVLLPGSREVALAWGRPGEERLQILTLSPGSPDTARSDNGARWAARERPGRVLDLATSPDGQWLLSGGLDRRVRAWPRGAGAPRDFCCAQEWGAFAVAMSHRGEYVAAGGAYGQVTLWLGSAPRVPLRSPNLHRDMRVTAAAFHPSDTLLLTAGRDTTVAVWTVPDLHPVLTLRGHTGWVQDAAYNHDGTRIVSASKDGTARVWDAGTGRLLAILRHPAGVRAARFNAAGNRIVTAGEDGLARVWEWNDRGLPLAVTALNLATPGTIVRGGGIEVGTPADSTIPEIRDVGGVWRLRQPRLHYGPVRGAVISRDGQRVATASEDGVHVWNPRTGDWLGGLEGGFGGIAGITFTPDDRLLVATAADGNTLVFDFGAHEIIARGRSGDDPYLLPRGYPWVLALFPGETQVYRCDVCVSPDELRRRFAGRIRPLTGEERSRYLGNDALALPP